MPCPYIPMTLTPCLPMEQLSASGGNVAQTRPRVKGFWARPRCLGASWSHNQSHGGWHLKSEAQSPKQIRNSKLKASKQRTPEGRPATPCGMFALPGSAASHLRHTLLTKKARLYGA